MLNLCGRELPTHSIADGFYAPSYKKLEIEIDLVGNGTDFAFVDTESGEVTNI